jgi:putative transposase
MPYKKHKQYRLPGYDYSAGGDYFITICTKNRLHHFGKIIITKTDAIIELTAIGSFVNDCILSIPGTYKDVTLGETIVMPNHLHLILHLPAK